MKKLIAFCLDNALFFNLATILVCIVGFIQILQTQREAFPNVAMDEVNIDTFYVGASPIEVDQYVTKPIEEYLQSVDGLKEVKSTSIHGYSFIKVRIDPDLSAAKKRKTLDDVQRAVQRIRNLPEGVQDAPLATELDSQLVPVIEVSLHHEDYDLLYGVYKEFKDQLKLIDGVSKVSDKGFYKKEYLVSIDPQKMKTFEITLQEVAAAIREQNQNLPGGEIVQDETEFQVRTIGELKTGEDIENVIVRTNGAGEVLRVQDIADVREGYEEPSRIYRTNSQKTISALVVKKESADIIRLSDKVKEFSKKFIAAKKEASDMYAGVEVSFVNDFSYYVRNRLQVIVNNGISGIILVFLILIIFLSPSISIVTALGMPTALLASFMVMGFAGLTINLITMFALILVLGMLVDDAIIVAENIWHHVERGMPLRQAAIEGTHEVFWPVAATIATSIAAFSPMLFVSGVFGKFIQYLPMVVIAALLMSLIEAMFVLPSHALHVVQFFYARFQFKENTWRYRILKRRQQIGAKCYQAYESLLRVSLRWRYGVFAVLFSVLAGSLFFAQTYMKVQLFPNDGVESFFIQVKLPVSYTLEQSEETIAKLEEVVASNMSKDDYQDFSSTVGIQSNAPNDPFTKRGSHYAQIQVFLRSVNERQSDAHKIIALLRSKIEDLQTQLNIEEFSVHLQTQGPPTGPPIFIVFSSENLDDLVDVTGKATNILKRYDEIRDIGTDMEFGKNEFRIYPDLKAANIRGIDVQTIATTVRAALNGQHASDIHQFENEVKIQVKLDENNIPPLGELLIPNTQGRLFPLKEIATISKEQGIQGVNRYDFKPVGTVTANIDTTRTTSSEVNQKFQAEILELTQNYRNMQVELEGEFKDTKESLESLRESFLYGVLLIFLILTAQFKSLVKPLLVMGIIPFGLTGVIWAFYFHDLPISFLGLVGAIGLSGVIVNDSIVLVDFINRGIDSATSVLEATVEAGLRRFRAVWLTTLTTVFGLIPVGYGIGGLDQFLKPAAIAVSYGLIFGTVLVLILVPCLYLISEDLRWQQVRKYGQGARQWLARFYSKVRQIFRR